jgi:hypothetical protein
MPSASETNSRYGEPEVSDELACRVTEILKQGLQGPFLAA